MAVARWAAVAAAVVAGRVRVAVRAAVVRAAVARAAVAPVQAVAANAVVWRAEADSLAAAAVGLGAAAATVVVAVVAARDRWVADSEVSAVVVRHNLPAVHAPCRHLVVPAGTARQPEATDSHCLVACGMQCVCRGRAAGPTCTV